jgi:hypothetical protein
MNFHKFANEDGEVLILKRIPQSRKTCNDFEWPSGVGSVVTCPDWRPDTECGGGLHGWPWGFGLGDGCDYDIISDIWLVVGAKPEDVIGEINGGAKCKARQVTIRLEGSFADAMAKVQPGFDACVAAMAIEQNAVGDSSKAASSGNYSKAASSGNSSKAASSGDSSTAASSGNYSTAASSGNSSKAASSGDYSTAASSGDYSTAASSGDSSKAASSGDSSTAASSGNSSKAASSGDYSKAASSGNSSKAASSGNYSKAASSGNYSTAASSGNYSTAASSGNSSKAASSGDSSTAASSGNYSTAASSGNYSTAASSGNSSKAEAIGKDTCAAVAGCGGRVRVGERGAFAIAYWTDADGYRFLAGKVGEGGVEANAWYEVQDGKLVKCDD